MSTRRLKKRDRDWAKGMRLLWLNDDGRSSRSGHDHRIARAVDAEIFLAGNDIGQQQALDIKP